MMDKINDERLFKEILQGVRNSGSEGLYSFLIGIGGGGTAYVECRCGEVFVQSVTFCEGKEKTERFVGTAVAAANFLLMRDADFSTISNSKIKNGLNPIGIQAVGEHLDDTLK